MLRAARCSKSLPARFAAGSSFHRCVQTALAAVVVLLASLWIAQIAAAQFNKDNASAILYQEDLSNSNGLQFDGSARWSTEDPSTDQIAVRADIEIPKAGMAAQLWLRRNNDATLSASHTIEIALQFSADFPHDGAANVPGLLMRLGATQRGVPLKGRAEKVTTNVFLLDLSAVEIDMQSNLRLLKERDWIDIPIVYGDGRRAILAIEKGTPGKEAFAAAFAAWQQ